MSAPSTSNWAPIGPATIWNGQTLATFGFAPTNRRYNERAPVCGRITAIALDPINPDHTVYAGAAQGGVWKSIDNGSTWIPKSDFEVSLAIGAISAVKINVNGVDSTRLYVGTGEANESLDSHYGAGILRSDDAGETWISLGQSEFLGAHIARIVVDPSDADIIYVASDFGVAKSTDAGATWSWLATGAVVTDLVIQSVSANGSVNKLIAGIKGGTLALWSSNTNTWTTANPIGTSGDLDRVSLANSSSNYSIVYAAFGSTNANTNSAVAGIMATVDGGSNWHSLSVPPNTSQSWYGLALGIHPTDPDTIYLGEVHLWCSNDAGATWNDVSFGMSANAHVALHADQHAIVFHPSADILYVGNDGGVWTSDKACTDWVALNIGMQLTQYTGFAADRAITIVAGAQDNGWQGAFGNPAATLLGFGDGGYAAIVETGGMYVTQSSGNQLGVWWSQDFGATWNVPVTTGLPSTNSEGYGFYPPFALTLSGIAYGGKHVFFQATLGAPWTCITGDLTNGSSGDYITAMRYWMPLGIIVGTSNGLLWCVSQAQNGSWSVNQITGLSGDPVTYISDMCYYNGKDQAFVVTSGFNKPHVWRGNIASGFRSLTTPIPNTNPAFCIATSATHRGIVFVGCDVGIYRSNDGGDTWSEWDTGLPNVAIADLAWTEDGSSGGILRAATHGRGIWERRVDGAPTQAVDLFLRHSDFDNGRLPQPGNGFIPPVPYPPVAVANGATLEPLGLMSPDVKIDTPVLTNGNWVYQNKTTNVNFADFASMRDCPPLPGRTMRVYVQMRNRGSQTAQSATARVFLCNFRGHPLGLYNVPNDFWAAFPNRDFAPSSYWSAIGPAKSVSNLRPGVPLVLEFDWTVASSVPGIYQQFLLVVITTPLDPVNETSLSPSDFVPRNKHTVVKPVDFPH